jgi:F0F1-type ATP synthase epsilon subunit
MPAELSFTVLTPSGALIQDQRVRKVRVRLMDGGLLSVYPHHATLIGETMTGEVLYVSEGREEHLRLEGGIFFVVDNTVSLYTSGRVGEKSEQAGPINEEDGRARFDRLASVLMSTLQAHPPQDSSDGAVEDSE